MLTKSKFLSGRRCPKRLLLQEFRPQLASPKTEAEKMRAEQGQNKT
jgi:hypothetical protein